LPQPSDGGIVGVEIRPLVTIPDERGAVMHMLRADAPHFQQFGEIYFSLVNPGRVKGWHRHRRMVSNYAVPVGRVRIAIYDARVGSPTNGRVLEIESGPAAYSLITIPPGTWSGFLGLGAGPSIVANCATLPHDPDEVDTMQPEDAAIPYRWETRE
jgi:dTDP-4-dehydrorhamnose 3,5-epimerase